MAERKLARREFNLKIMNRNWDLSNDAYVMLIEAQRELESALQKQSENASEQSRIRNILLGPKERERA